MNVERLHAIAAALRADLDSSTTLSILQSLVSSLSNQVNQPGQPQYQQQTSQFYTQLLQALEQSEGAAGSGLAFKLSLKSTVYTRDLTLDIAGGAARLRG